MMDSNYKKLTNWLSTRYREGFWVSDYEPGVKIGKFHKFKMAGPIWPNKATEINFLALSNYEVRVKNIKV